MDDLGSLVLLLVGFGIAFVVFLAIRSVLLWYWRINEIVKHQEEVLYTLKYMATTLDRIAPPTKPTLPSIHQSQNTHPTRQLTP